MEQVAWASLGLLAAGMFGSFFYLASKIDALQASLIARIDARMDASDESHSGRIDSLSGRIDSLSGRIDSLSDRIDALGARLDSRIDSLSGLLQAHIERHAG